MRLVSNRQRPEMLLTLLQSIGGPAQQRVLWPKWQLRMRNSAIGPKSKKPLFSDLKAVKSFKKRFKV